MPQIECVARIILTHPELPEDEHEQAELLFQFEQQLNNQGIVKIGDMEVGVRVHLKSPQR